MNWPAIFLSLRLAATVCLVLLVVGAPVAYWMAVEIPGGSHRRVAARSASHGTRLLHAGGAWSEESGGQVCRIGIVHSTHFLLCRTGHRIGALQSAICRSTHGKRIWLRRPQASRRSGSARCVEVAQILDDHSAAGQGRRNHRRCAELRAYDRRIRSRAHGRRQYSRRDANDFNRDLRRGSGARLYGGGAHIGAAVDFFFPDSRARVRSESAKLTLVVEPAERLNVLTAEIRLQLSSSFRLDCAFEIPAGFTVLFGPSGAGKTSVLDCIAGIKTPDSGKIAIDGKAMFDSSQGLNLWPSQRRLAYVFQSLALFPHLSVAENVAYGLRHEPKNVVMERSRKMLAQFGIEQLRGRQPGDLSGGERQRVALARSLVTEPCALFSTSRWRLWIGQRERKSWRIFVVGMQLKTSLSST